MTTQLNISLVNLIAEKAAAVLHSIKKVEVEVSHQRDDYLRLTNLPDYLLRDIGVTREQVNQKLTSQLWMN